MICSRNMVHQSNVAKAKWIRCEYNQDIRQRNVGEPHVFSDCTSALCIICIRNRKCCPRRFIHSKQ
uniref:Uncharacterized protein n=1 Tax=Aegilops tauschii subsp. strangulata TaxID=200361 RepID=A0A452XN07_AEGTS